MIGHLLWVRVHCALQEDWAIARVSIFEESPGTTEQNAS